MKSKKAALDLSIGEIIGLIIIGALLVWFVFWSLGLTDTAKNIGRTFFK